MLNIKLRVIQFFLCKNFGNGGHTFITLSLLRCGRKARKGRGRRGDSLGDEGPLYSYAIRYKYSHLRLKKRVSKYRYRKVM
jgi:hypothetical protein